MNKIITKIALFSLVIGSMLNLSAVEVTATDLKTRAAERVSFWQAVVAGLNKTGYKSDSEFAKRANTNLARAETHQQIVRSGKYVPVATRSRKSTRFSKSTKTKIDNTKKVEPKKETKATKEVKDTKKETKEAKSKRQERVDKRKEARAKKAQEAKKAKASKLATTVKK